MAIIESWSGAKDATPKLDGMILVGKINAEKKCAVGKGRKSGGILVYAREKMSNVVSIVEVLPKNPSSIWIKVKNIFF